MPDTTPTHVVASGPVQKPRVDYAPYLEGIALGYYTSALGPPSKPRGQLETFVGDAVAVVVGACMAEYYVGLEEGRSTFQQLRSLACRGVSKSAAWGLSRAAVRTARAASWLATKSHQARNLHPANKGPRT